MKTSTGNISVKNLDKSIDNKALHDTFSLFGNIVSCKVASDNDGNSKGHGFVHYETDDAARMAIEKVNGMQIGEKTMDVTLYAKPDTRGGKDGFTNWYAKNMPSGFDETLKEMFGPFGAIASSCVMQDKQDRPFAFINYERQAQRRPQWLP